MNSFAFSSRLAIPAAVLGLYVACVLAYFFPFLHQPGVAIPSTFPDGWIAVWNIWRMGLVFGGSPESLYHTALLYYPEGASTVLHTMTEGIVLPFVWFTHLTPVSSYCLLSMLLFLFSAVSSYALFASAGVNRAVALTFSLVFAFHPFFTAHLQGGHLNLLAIFPGILMWLVWQRIKAGSGAHAGPVLGALAAYQGYCDLYYLYFFTLLIGLDLLLRLLLKRELSTILLRQLAVALLVALPLAWPKISLIWELTQSQQYSPNHDPLKHSADLVHLVLPGSLQFFSSYIGSLEIVGMGIVNRAESGCYIGLALTILAFAFRTTNFWPRCFLACIFFILSLGPLVSYCGVALFTNPLYRLLSWLPLFPSVPARFAIMGELLLFEQCALNVSAAFSGEASNGKRMLLGCLLFLVALEFYPAALRFSVQPASPVAEQAAQRKDIAAILDTDQDVANAMFRQTIHHKPIAGGFLARSPRAARSKLRRNPFVEYLNSGDVPSKLEVENGLYRLEVDALITAVGSNQSNQMGRLPIFRRVVQDGQTELWVAGQIGEPVPE